MSKKHYGGTTADGKGKGAVITVTVIILALIIALVTSIGSYGFTQKDFKKWFNGWGKGNETLQPDDPDTTGDGSGGNMVLTPGEESGLRLMSAYIAPADYEANGISAQAETAYTLTATVFDGAGNSNGMPQLVNFAASWESSGTTGNVNEYVGINRLTENSANIICLKAFPAPIIITVTAANSNVSATKRCEYVKRLNTFEVYIPQITIDMPTSITPSKTLGTGTKEGTIYVDNITYTLAENFINALINSAYYKYFKQLCEAENIILDIGNEIVIEEKSNISNSINFNLSYFLLSNMDSATVQEIVNKVGLDYFKYAVIYATSQTQYVVQYKFTYMYKYNGNTYSSGMTNTVPPIAFDTSCLGTLPTAGDVGLSGNGDIIF